MDRAVVTAVCLVPKKDGHMCIGELKFADGKSVWIDSVAIASSYEGVLEGGPGPELNALMRRRAMEKAKRVFYESAYEIEPSLQADTRGRLALPANDPQRMMSMAIVIWYQDEACPIVGGQFVAWAKNMPWSKIGRDGDW
jgi:hypothetical protein